MRGFKTGIKELSEIVARIYDFNKDNLEVIVVTRNNYVFGFIRDNGLLVFQKLAVDKKKRRIFGIR